MGNPENILSFQDCARWSALGHRRPPTTDHRESVVGLRPPTRKVKEKWYAKRHFSKRSWKSSSSKQKEISLFSNFLYKCALKHGFKSCKINLNKRYSNRILFKILLCRFAERLEKRDVPQTYKIIC